MTPTESLRRWSSHRAAGQAEWAVLLNNWILWLHFRSWKYLFSMRTGILPPMMWQSTLMVPPSSTGCLGCKAPWAQQREFSSTEESGTLRISLKKRNLHRTPIHYKRCSHILSAFTGCAEEKKNSCIFKKNFKLSLKNSNCFEKQVRFWVLILRYLKIKANR